GVSDPFLYAEVEGVRHVVIGSMDIPSLAGVGAVELHPFEEYGVDELLGLSVGERRAELARRAVAALGVTSAVVPAAFPLWIADALRSSGVELVVDGEFFDDRRRVKSAAELAGIRQAQRAAEAGMDAARDLLRRAAPNGDGLGVDGEPLTVERVKAAISVAFTANRAGTDDLIVGVGAQAADPHDLGSGPIRPGVPIVIDIWPRDNESAMYTDMTRTFVVGDVPDDVRRWHALAEEALGRAVSELADGADPRAIFDGTCEIFEAAGEPTRRQKQPGETQVNGFFHDLGHGVGLEVHEAPHLGLSAKLPLRAGDVLAIEPGCYREGYGGVRLEDVVLVGPDGGERLTEYPYDLDP
ncbi:MAG TPA: M24 family metallopeptidase, partial [Gaiellaceae bacterium]|nr:M24 family metallopeptidase [Gaiellaceae bacterium]